MDKIDVSITVFFYLCFLKPFCKKSQDNAINMQLSILQLLMMKRKNNIYNESQMELSAPDPGTERGSQ